MATVFNHDRFAILLYFFLKDNSRNTTNTKNPMNKSIPEPFVFMLQDYFSFEIDVLIKDRTNKENA